MTNAQLKTIVNDTIEDVFNGKKDVRITIGSVRGNGVYVCVEHRYKVENRGRDGWHYEYAHIGFGCPKYYAITGADNVKKAVREHFEYYT